MKTFHVWMLATGKSCFHYRCLQCWLTLYNKFHFLIHQLQCMDHLEIWKETRSALNSLKNDNKNSSRILQEFLENQIKNSWSRWFRLLGLPNHLENWHCKKIIPYIIQKKILEKKIVYSHILFCLELSLLLFSFSTP